MSKATFAAGCFWGVQNYFDQVPGVTRTTVGYTGGHTENPSYEEVCTHTTGHAEAVEVQFDTKEVTFETLAMHFFRMHDPTQLNRQGPDVGDSYRSAIFYYGEDQKVIAHKVREEFQNEFKEPIVTEITEAGKFYPAEEYHQKFTEKTGRGMCRVEYRPVN